MSSAGTKPEPHSKEAEVATLGSILLDNACYDQAAIELQPQDFYLDSHRRIWASMVELYEAGKPIDFVTLCEQMGHADMVSVGGAGYVTNLTDGLPRVKNIGQYVRIVKEQAALRQVIQISNGARAAAYEQGTQASHIAGTVQEQFLTMLGDSKKGSAAKVGDFSEETWNRLVQRRESKQDVLGFPTGLTDLDRLTMGIWKKEFWVVGGRPNSGKTPLALQIAAANCKRGVPVGIFSLEMSRHELLDRLWCAESGIGWPKIRDPRMMTIEDAERLDRARRRIEAWPLWIEDAAKYTLQEVCARMRLLIRQHKIEIGIVDFIQLIKVVARDRRLEMDKIVEELPALAKAEDIAIVALSQLAREEQRNINRRPNMHDFKESGAIESNANVCVMTFRPQDEYDQPTGEDELVLAKHRAGRRGIVRAWMSDCMCWRART